MAVLVRIIVCAIIYLIIHFAISRSKKAEGKKTWDKIILAICVVIAAISCLVPIENAFVTFSSPQKAYNYWNRSEKVILVIDGEDTTRVIEKKGNDTFADAILPKTKGGWKLAGPLDNVHTETRVYNNVIIWIYNRDGSEDYYLQMFDSGSKKELQITDSLGSEIFDYKEYDNRLADSTKWYYFTCVNNLDADYKLTVDGETFSVLDDTMKM